MPSSYSRHLDSEVRTWVWLAPGVILCLAALALYVRGEFVVGGVCFGAAILCYLASFIESRD